MALGNILVGFGEYDEVQAIRAARKQRPEDMASRLISENLKAFIERMDGLGRLCHIAGYAGTFLHSALIPPIRVKIAWFQSLYSANRTV